MSGRSVRVRGVVQGVGFRPYIWRLAKQHRLTGSVWNDNEGVMIHIWGDAPQMQAFVDQIPLELPPLAIVESVEWLELEHAASAPADFSITGSRSQETARTPVAADAATCHECLKEVNDPISRRYRYPFTNCTHCGPRLSIVTAVPYDRCNTSMAEFVMCSRCQLEYDDPADRRFHAQANCCPDCGPQIWLEDRHGDTLHRAERTLQETAELLKRGYIVAIKGLGGFHLACDAGNEAAVAELRRRKRRYEKPLALMARDLEMVSRYARISVEEKRLLESSAAPIVILAAQGERLADGIVIDDTKLGFMLPYTPMHFLLLQQMSRPLVMTSGNLSEEPQCVDNEEARSELGNIADYFLLHDRAIVNRQDDSVVRVMAGGVKTIRRARGYSPAVLTLPQGFEQGAGILAMGAELKNSFCLIKNGQSIVSQHIGDLEDAATQRDYRKNIALYRQLFAFEPTAIAVDMHPSYLSTQYGRQWAEGSSLALQPIQHHHAHVASCMAEHGLALDSAPVLGIVYDGLGMGENGALWGGEFLLADYFGFRRLAHMEAVAMPGGVQAIREPWRNAFAQLDHYFEWSEIQQQFSGLEFIRTMQGKPLDILKSMIAKGVNSPSCSSCGRWFDAFAALLGLTGDKVSYEGQAAVALENLAAPVFGSHPAYADAYVLHRQSQPYRLVWKPLWQLVLSDLQRGVDKAVVAARIHRSLGEATVATVLELSEQTKTDTVVLSGGVFQNRLLLESVRQQLLERGKSVLIAQDYPINDGGVALGQAAIAAASLLAKGRH